MTACFAGSKCYLLTVCYNQGACNITITCALPACQYYYFLTMAAIKTVKSWEKSLSTDLEKEITGSKVTKVKCKVCCKYESRITSIKGFSRRWIEGTDSVKKDSLMKHVNGDPHKFAVELQQKESLGAARFNEKVIEATPIGRGLKKMTEEEGELLKNRFNSAYYLSKSERPYSDFEELLELQEKNGAKYHKGYRNERSAANFVDTCGQVIKDNMVQDLLNAKYYSVLMDGSTDSSVTEQELIYLLFLGKNGIPEVKFFSVESVKAADADGLKSSLKEAFERIGILCFENRLHGLNVDGASVNTGVHRGLGAKIRELAPWLTFVHCFNHRLELAVKDTFKGTFFDEIDTMLLKLYYLYKKSAKRTRELQAFGEVYEKVITRPVKSSGTGWVAHKVNAMEIVLMNYSIFIMHLESLAQTDSQELKRAELQGFAKLWRQAKFPLHLAIYLDILQPIKVLSLAMQQDTHDPVLQVKHIKEFSWTMVKLNALLTKCIDKTATRLTNYTKFLNDVQHKEGSYKYKGVELLNFDASSEKIKKSYEEIISCLSAKLNARFEDLKTNPVFQSIIVILDCNRWPRDDLTLSTFAEKEIDALTKHFSPLLSKNGCLVEKIVSEWDILKLEVRTLISGCREVKYLDVWQRVFTVLDRSSYENVLHLIELLLITPTTNAKLERMFSRMKRVKSDWRNRLTRERLEHNLRIGEDGPSIKDFNPTEAIAHWQNTKIRRVNNAQPHRYPDKRRKTETSSSVDVVSYCLSDFDSSSSDESETEFG